MDRVKKQNVFDKIQLWVKFVGETSYVIFHLFRASIVAAQRTVWRQRPLMCVLQIRCSESEGNRQKCHSKAKLSSKISGSQNLSKFTFVIFSFLKDLQWSWRLQTVALLLASYSLLLACWFPQTAYMLAGGSVAEKNMKEIKKRERRAS